MTIADRDIWHSSTPPDGPRPFRFTVEQYEDLIDKGIYEGRRVELIDGEVIEMPGMSEPHATSIALVNRVLFGIFEPQSHIRVQMPFLVPPRSLPEPDLAVISGSPRDVEGARPQVALLLVEVCLSTASEDRGRKPFLYASGGAQEYWLLDLRARRMEVYRKPITDCAALFGHRYGSLTIHEEGETICPLARPDASILIADLLPRKIDP